MECTVIFSLKPGTPAFRQQMPRTTSSIFTPAQDASYRQAMISRSQREFIFAMMWAGFPSLARAVSLRIMRTQRLRSHNGARIRRFQVGGSE